MSWQTRKKAELCGQVTDASRIMWCGAGYFVLYCQPELCTNPGFFFSVHTLPQLVDCEEIFTEKTFIGLESLDLTLDDLVKRNKIMQNVFVLN